MNICIPNKYVHKFHLFDPMLTQKFHALIALINYIYILQSTSYK